MRKALSILLAAALMLAAAFALAETDISLDTLVDEIDAFAEVDKAFTVGPVSFEISPDRQSIYLTRPAVTCSGDYTIAYNIYDADSYPVNYFYSLEDRVAATPGYGGLFNVFVVVTEMSTGAQFTQNIGWQKLSWRRGGMLIVGPPGVTLSPDRRTLYVDRPDICSISGEVTIAYNIYDGQSNPVNYFYSTQKRVAATPGYAGHFIVFIVVTDTGTNSQCIQSTGWYDLAGDGPQPTADPTAEPTAEPTAPPEPTPDHPEFVRETRNGEVTVHSYTGTDEIVTVPDTLDGLPVRAIGNKCFAGNKTLKYVVLPESLTSIGNNAFTGCSTLEKIRIPSRVTSLGQEAFSYCTALTAVEIDGPVRALKQEVFFKCTSLASLSLSEGLETIEYHAFRWCSALQTIPLPDSLREIQSSAFEDCGLVTLKIPDGVTEMGVNTFLNCKQLKEIVLPKGITAVPYMGFYNCYELLAITLPENINLVSSHAFEHCWKLAEVTVYNREASFGVNCFFDCCDLSRIVGYRGSTAETLAQNNGLRFIPLD
ncbi:MAG: leucine-rich repeat domain-containing protein [Clostridia bacterium]|nr:leucine-rich repeat domain-containing protein [Clostridia bacterium]